MNKKRTPKPVSCFAAAQFLGVTVEKLNDFVAQGKFTPIRAYAGDGNDPVLNMHDLIEYEKTRIRRTYVMSPFGKKTYFWFRPNNSWDIETIHEVKDTYFSFVPIEPHDRWLDAGAHIGAFSLFVAPIVENVFALEPEEENFELLRRNIQGHKGTGAFIGARQKALGRSNGLTRLHKNPTSTTTMHSILPIHKKATHALEAETVNFTQEMLMRNLNAVKLDIEGAEFHLLEDILRNQRIKKLVMEWHRSFRPVATKEGIYVPTVPELKELFEKSFTNVRFQKTKKETIIHAFGRIER